MALGSIDRIVSPRTGKVSYRARWSFVDQTGTRRHRSESFPTKKRAQDRLAKVQHELRTGAYVEASDELIGPFVDRWLERMRRVWRDGSYAANMSRWKNHGANVIGHLRFRDLQLRHVQRYYDGMGQRGYMPKTVQSIHALLDSAIDAAVAEGYLPFNPISKAVLPKTERSTPAHWNQEASHRFLAFVANDRDVALWNVLLRTGMRIGEALALRWSDVDLQRGTATLHRTISIVYGKGEQIVEGTKTPSSMRTVTLTEPCIQALKRHRVQQWEALSNPPATWKDHGLVFCRVDGRPLRRNGVRDRLLALCRHYEVDELRPHGLRHTGASLAMAAGIHPKLVQEMLGHGNIAITINTYSHVSESLRRSAYEQLDAILDSEMQQHDPDETPEFAGPASESRQNREG